MKMDNVLNRRDSWSERMRRRFAAVLAEQSQLSWHNDKRNNSNYKDVYISTKQNLYPKKSYSIVKLDSIQEIKKTNSS